MLWEAMKGTLSNRDSENGERQQGGLNLISKIVMVDDIQLAEPAGSGAQKSGVEASDRACDGAQRHTLSHSLEDDREWDSNS